MQLKHYASHIHLFDPWPIQDQQSVTLDSIVDKLTVDPTLSIYAQRYPAPTKSIEQKEQWVRTMLTLRPAGYYDETLFKAIDLWLTNRNQSKVLTDISQLKVLRQHDSGAQLFLWQGDITTLKVDAIVNAANSQMQGCFQPFHACIDNAIHSVAGPRLREDCHTIIKLQGTEELTSKAKITRGYNLPAKFVLHTVGPIIPSGSQLTDDDREALANCYTRCLELAAECNNIESMAFCAISTGVFGFPKEEAAVIAVKAVNEWLNHHDHPFKRLIFNTFDNHTTTLYQNELMS